MAGPPKIRYKAEHAKATASGPDLPSPPVSASPPVAEKDAHEGGDPDVDPDSTAETANVNSSNFPQKLMKIMSGDGIEGVIEWCRDGEAIIIKDRARLSNEILPRYFGEAEYRSFTRRLLRWGFKRITKGPETGAFHHESFLRDKPELCSQIITCQKIRTADRRTKRNLSVDEASNKIAVACNRSSKKRRKSDEDRHFGDGSNCKTPDEAKSRSFLSGNARVITHSGGEPMLPASASATATAGSILNRLSRSDESARAASGSALLRQAAPGGSPFLPSMRDQTLERLVHAEIMQRESALNARVQADLLQNSLREVDHTPELLRLRLAASRNAEAAAAAAASSAGAATTSNYPSATTGFNHPQFGPNLLAIAQARAAILRNAPANTNAFQQQHSRQALYESAVTNMQQRLDMERLALLRRAQLEASPTHQLAAAMAAKRALSSPNRTPSAHANAHASANLAFAASVAASREREAAENSLDQRMRLFQAQFRHDGSPSSNQSSGDRKLPARRAGSK